jgi:hypothetical protein
MEFGGILPQDPVLALREAQFQNVFRNMAVIVKPLAQFKRQLSVNEEPHAGKFLGH